ncbi:MAG: peptidylprolyl isomerase [Alphaproteobacteria bacterium]|nr:peptidylprolyl isomerase [Alphaproteobacteria bacterium]
MTAIETLTVNGVAIPLAAVEAEVQYHPANSLDEARRLAAEALVVRELLLQEASRRGVTGDSPEDAVAALIESAVQTPEADDAACRRYYDNNRKRFRSPDLYEAQHILIAADPDDAEAREAALRKAEVLLADIAREPQRFEALAREHSDCPSKDSGGHLGQVTRGSTVPEFETYLCSLDEGETCAAPVPSRYGMHIVRLLRREPGRDLDYPMVRETIAAYLHDHAWRMGVRQYIQVLAGAARIEGIDIAAAGSPLVQ